MPVAYVLLNEYMPGLVKVGCCPDRPIEDRIKELSRATGVPVPFECFYAIDIPEPRELEQTLFAAFSDRRINPRREFLQLDPEQPAAILREFVRRGLATDVTPRADITDSAEEEAALQHARRRAPNFRFDMAGVPNGAVLRSSFDDNVEATAIHPNRVRLEGEELSLSDAADRIATRMGYHWAAVQGPAFWTYEGRKLTELRAERELGQAP